MSSRDAAGCNFPTFHTEGSRQLKALDSRPEMLLPKGAQSGGQPASDCSVLQMQLLPESRSRGLKIKNSAATQSNASEVGGDAHRGRGGTQPGAC